MKKIALLAALLLPAFAGGCAELMAVDGAALSAPGPCGVLARQRLDDARLAGLADGYEKAIFDNSYKDCLTRQANDPVIR